MKIKADKRTLPKEGRSTLNKAVKNVKEILQSETKSKKEKLEPKKVVTVQKIVKRKWKNRHQKDCNRGIVYLGHIPHGFYENQMREYFQQFGHVLRVRLCRSHVTGKSRGYGFIEFPNLEVAQIAAQTMNNYLMCGRLLKATYIPPEKQHDGFFSKFHWTKEHYPRKLNRIREVRKLNASESNEEHKKFVHKTVKKLTKLSNMLEEQGIELDFPISCKKG